MSGLQIPLSNNQYTIQFPLQEKEDKNFFEGVLWGLNGVQNILAGVSAVGGALILDGLSITALSSCDAGTAVAGAVALVGVNVLAYYVIKAEFSIASKSFTHMKNTIL